MNINFENLERIEEVYKLLLLMKHESKIHIEKRWLTSDELATYTGFSLGTIKKLIKEKKLKAGIHFYQKIKRNTFDKQKIDEWIMNEENEEENEDNEKIISRKSRRLIIDNIIKNVA